MKKLIYIGLILIIALMLSCSSTKKNIARSESKTQSTLEVDSTASSSKIVDASLVKNEVSDEESNEEVIEYDGLPGDTLSVKKYGENGKLLSETKISGKGKAKISKNKKKSHKSQSETKHESAKTDGKIHLRKKALASTSNSSFQKHKESSGLSFWTYFWIILLIIILVILWYLNKRYQWLGSSVKYVTGLFRR